MRVSVVIPTRDRHALLADCLASLGEQEPLAGGFDVVVVDDGSREPLAPVVDAAAAAGLQARCVHQEPAGLNAARNRGIDETDGEVVAFLDDDTLVEPGWAGAILEAFETTGYDAVGGRVVLRLDGGATLPRWVTEKRLSYLSSYDLGHAPADVDGPPLPVGANFAARRDRLDALGGFRAGLDRVGRDLISNGELDLLERLQAGGGSIGYWPAAAVLHRVPTERLTKEWFRRRARAQGISDVRTHPLDGGVYAARAAREVVRGGRAVPILIRRLAEGRGLFDAELWLIASRARLGELRRQRSTRA